MQDNKKYNDYLKETFAELEGTKIEILEEEIEKELDKIKTIDGIKSSFESNNTTDLVGSAKEDKRTLNIKKKYAKTKPIISKLKK